MVKPRKFIHARQDSGFTWVELLVIIAVLAILSDVVFRSHGRPVPYKGLAVVLWLVFTCATPALVQRVAFAYLLGVLVTAALLGYCMYHGAWIEFDGLPQA